MTSPTNMPSTPINPQVQHYMLPQYPPHPQPPHSPHMVPPVPIYSEVHHILPQYPHPSYQQLPHPQPPHQQLTVINHHYYIHPQPSIQHGQMPNMPVQQPSFHYPLHGHNQIMPTPLLHPASDPNVDLSLTIPKERLILTQDETSQPPNQSPQPSKFQLNNIKYLGEGEGLLLVLEGLLLILLIFSGI